MQSSMEGTAYCAYGGDLNTLGEKGTLLELISEGIVYLIRDLGKGLISE